MSKHRSSDRRFSTRKDSKSARIAARQQKQVEAMRTAMQSTPMSLIDLGRSLNVPVSADA